MKNRLLLLLYIVSVAAVSAMHDWRLLATVFAFLILLCGRDAVAVLGRSVAAAAIFSGFISLSYIIASIAYDRSWVEYVAMLNLRVLDMTMMAFLLIRRVNLFDALSFSRSLSLILTLSVSRIESYKKLYDSFVSALKARSMKPIGRKGFYDAIASIASLFLSKSVSDSRESFEAMRARGFYV